MIRFTRSISEEFGEEFRTTGPSEVEEGVVDCGFAAVSGLPELSVP
jgi:hypothetical protein